MSTFVPLQTGFTRVFLIEGRARADHEPSYEHQLKMGGLEQSFGEVTNIYSPDPRNYGKFEVLGAIRQEEERPTTSLVGRYAADLASELLRLAKLGCENDVQLHIGQCTNPADFNTFTKAVIIEAALIPGYSTDELGALQPDEKAVVNETAEISGIRVYEVLPLSFAERAGDVVTNEVIDVVICDQISCGECDELSDGCQKIFAVTLGAGGSPGTPADVVWSLDGGATWYARDIDTLSGDPNGVACVGRYLVVIGSSAPSGHHITLLSDFNAATTVLSWTNVGAGAEFTQIPQDIWSVGTLAFVVGAGGYVWKISDPTSSAEILDAGVATTEDLRGVHAISEDFAVAVGTNGAVIFTQNQTIWTAALTAPTADDLETVWVKSENEWWVGDNAGNIWFTLDQGVTWTQKEFSGDGSGTIYDIAFSSASVGYLVQDQGAVGRILRTYDGGFSWNVLPEGEGLLPDNDSLRAVAACVADPNFVVAVGLGGNGVDGIILLGED